MSTMATRARAFASVSSSRLSVGHSGACGKRTGDDELLGNLMAKINEILIETNENLESRITEANIVGLPKQPKKAELQSILIEKVLHETWKSRPTTNNNNTMTADIDGLKKQVAQIGQQVEKLVAVSMQRADSQNIVDHPVSQHHMQAEMRQQIPTGHSDYGEREEYGRNKVAAQRPGYGRGHNTNQPLQPGIKKTFSQVVGRRTDGSSSEGPQLKGKQMTTKQRTQSFYIGNVDNQTVKDVEQYVQATYKTMAGETLKYIKVFPLIRKTDSENTGELESVQAGSFRIIVNAEQADFMLNGAFWPLGVRARQWEYKQQSARRGPQREAQDPHADVETAVDTGEDGWHTVLSKRRRSQTASPTVSNKQSRQAQEGGEQGDNSM